MGIDGTQSVDRALALLLRLVDDGGQHTLADLGRAGGLAPSTSYRLGAALRKAGMIVSTGRGRFVAGPALASRQDRLSLSAALAAAARPILKYIAQQGKCVAHLGVLESDMVTYLVREGANVGNIHSEEGKQLEAYCSGIGKMLLAGLSVDARDAYLGSAPFVALTDRTITNPEELRAELAAIAAQGFARDEGEGAPEITCIAVPIKGRDCRAVAAISLSWTAQVFAEGPALRMLQQARAELEEGMFEKSLPSNGDPKRDDRPRAKVVQLP